MVFLRSTVQPKTERERDLARAEDLLRLRDAYIQGKQSGDGEFVTPKDFLKELKAERGERG